MNPVMHVEKAEELDKSHFIILSEFFSRGKTRWYLREQAQTTLRILSTYLIIDIFVCPRKEKQEKESY